MDGFADYSPTDAAFCQHTLASEICAVGVGLHSGARVRITLGPAAENTGIVFRRSDLGIDLPARFDRVGDTRLCTVLADGPARVGTVEHVMAALAAAGIDNALIGVDGPEVPVLDGSAEPFSFLIACAGRARQTAPRRVIEILAPVRVAMGEGFAELRPHATTEARGGSTAPLARASLDLSVSIEFPARAIGRQALSLTLSDEGFVRELARARTFTLLSEIEALRAAGLARGGSLENAVVVDDATILNPEGLRSADEFVRHKMLDAVGDLALAGAAIHGRFIAHRPGHAMNNQLLRTLFNTPGAWRETALSLPASGWFAPLAAQAAD